jgi:prolycopene isomerase
MNATVIGSGLSGLTTAAVLARVGHCVTVLEQYHRPGGVTAPFERDGFRWNLGQLLIEDLGPDEPLGLILADLDLADQIAVDRYNQVPEHVLLIIGSCRIAQDYCVCT